MTNLYIADQQLRQASSPSLVTFEQGKAGNPTVVLIPSSTEDEVQLELPMATPEFFQQDPLIAEALRIFEAQIA